MESVLVLLISLSMVRRFPLGDRSRNCLEGRPPRFVDDDDDDDEAELEATS